MNRRKWIILVAVISAILLIDQLSKGWVLANMRIGETILVIPALHPYFQLTFSTNTGAAFGILPMAGGLFMLLAVLICGVILFIYYQTPHAAVLQQIGLSMVLGGASGNVIDRLQHGFVVDFVHIVLPGIVSNVSNFADHFIVLGVVMLVIDNIRQEHARRRQATPVLSEPPPTD